MIVVRTSAGSLPHFCIQGWQFYLIFSIKSNSQPLLKVGDGYQVLSVMEWTALEYSRIHSVTALGQVSSAIVMPCQDLVNVITTLSARCQVRQRCARICSVFSTRCPGLVSVLIVAKVLPILATICLGFVGFCSAVPRYRHPSRHCHHVIGRPGTLSGFCHH